MIYTLKGLCLKYRDCIYEKVVWGKVKKGFLEDMKTTCARDDRKNHHEEILSMSKVSGFQYSWMPL